MASPRYRCLSADATGPDRCPRVAAGAPGSLRRSRRPPVSLLPIPGGSLDRVLVPIVAILTVARTLPLGTPAVQSGPASPGALPRTARRGQAVVSPDILAERIGREFHTSCIEPMDGSGTQLLDAAASPRPVRVGHACASSQPRRRQCATAGNGDPRESATATAIGPEDGNGKGALETFPKRSVDSQPRRTPPYAWRPLRRSVGCRGSSPSWPPARPRLCHSATKRPEPRGRKKYVSRVPGAPTANPGQVAASATSRRLGPRQLARGHLGTPDHVDSFDTDLRERDLRRQRSSDRRRTPNHRTQESTTREEEAVPSPPHRRETARVGEPPTSRYPDLRDHQIVIGLRSCCFSSMPTKRTRWWRLLNFSHALRRPFEGVYARTVSPPRLVLDITAIAPGGWTLLRILIGARESSARAR